MSQFVFLSGEWPQVASTAMRAEALAYPDPRTACFYARRALELAVAWAYKHDPALKLPYQDNLSALIHEPSFKKAAGEAVFTKARLIVTLGNQAVHSTRPIAAADAVTAARELFHVAYWLARTYGRSSRPEPGLRFDPATLPKITPVPAQTVAQLQTLEAQLHERDEKLSKLLADRSALDEELTRLRAQVAEARKAATAQPDTHDYSEAETRDAFIDLLLHEAGWPLDQPRDREFEVAGMPNRQGKGFVDYVLWGDDGLPLAVLEAKRTRRDARVGQQQAKLYADCLEQQFGQRPLIFYSNGYQHWLWDDLNYPPRQVQGFYTQAELALALQRRRTRQPLATAEIDTHIVERYYQSRARGARPGLVRADAGRHGPRSGQAGAGRLPRRQKTLNASQIEFLNLIANHLTQHGVMEAAVLYESPFIDIAPQGPEGLFTSTQVDELVAVLARIHHCPSDVRCT